jgi:hypothetical protein
VVTDEGVSGGWIAWMPTKRLSTTTADKPDQPRRCEAVVVTLLSLISALAER